MSVSAVALGTEAFSGKPADLVGIVISPVRGFLPL